MDTKDGGWLELKDDGWSVEGWVARYTPDLGGDVIEPGAFKATLADGHRVRFLYAHQPSQVLGVPLSLHEDGRDGLYGRFRISRTRLGEEVRTLLKDGALDSFSFGYVVKRSEADRERGLRRLQELELIEASVVAMPMHPEARVTAAKAAGRESLVAPYLYRRRVGELTSLGRQAEAVRLRLRLLTAG